jgi:imidazolonepropionase-like amidohydrolase
LPGDGTLAHEWLSRYDDGVLGLVALKNLQQALIAGVTTVRDLGARNNIAFTVRHAIQEGLVLGPRVLVCGRSLTITGGHCHYFNGEADGVDGIRSAARLLLKQGADVIKIIGSGGGTPGTNARMPTYTAEEIRTAVDEAHRLGRPTTAHVTCTTAINNAVDAGADMLEHCAFFESSGEHRFDEALVDKIAQLGLFVGPTIQASYGVLMQLRAASPRTPSQERMLRYREQLFTHTMETVGRLYTAGVRIVANTDAGWDINHFGHYAVGLRLMSEAGVPAEAVIGAATRHAADAVGLGREIGTVEPGKAADLIVVDGDPLKDTAALGRVRAVYLNGAKVVENGRLVQMSPDYPA